MPILEQTPRILRTLLALPISRVLSENGSLSAVLQGQPL